MINPGNIQNSIFFKLMLSFFALFMLFTAIVWGVFGFYASEYKIAKMNSTKNMMQNIVSEFDKNVFDIQGIMNDFKNSAAVFGEIDSISDSGNSPVKDILRYYLNRNKNIENILIINSKGYWEGISRDNKFINSVYDFNSEAWFNEIMADKSDDKIYITGLHSQSYFNGMNDYVFGFVKKFYDNDGLSGILIIDINIEYFVNAYNNSGFTDAIEFMALSADKCIYSTNLNLVDAYVEPEKIPVCYVSQISDDLTKGGELFYISEKSDLTDWVFYAKFSRKHLFKELDSIRLALVISNIVITLLIVIISLRSVLSLFYPIKSILDKIKQVKEGNFEIKKTVNSKDELGEISSAVDDMASSLKKHIEREYFCQIKQKEAELNALKMQIRPHFLYNTLEIISMTAREEKADKTSKMISSLGAQLRYLLGGADDMVKLSDEIEMINNYMKIVKLRQQNVIDIVFNIDDDTLDCYVLKLIIQPIVENSIKHAAVGKDLTITLGSYVMDDIVVITVYDNGCGMSEDKIEKVLKGQSHKSKHIGLGNINERIQLLFGQNYGIKIESSVNMGTLVKIIVPKILNRGTNNEK